MNTAPVNRRERALTLAFLNAVPFPIPIGYVVLGHWMSVGVGTFMRLFAPFVGLILVLMFLVVFTAILDGLDLEELIYLGFILVLIFFTAITEGPDASIFGDFVSDILGHHGVPSVVKMLVIGFSFFLLFAPTVLVLGLNARDAWKMGMGRKGMFESKSPTAER